MHKKRVIIYFIIVIFLFVFNFYLRPVEGNKLVDKSYKSNSAYINDLYYSNELFKSELSYDGKKLYEAIVDASINDKTEVRIECNEDCSRSFNDSYDAVYLDHPELISFVGLDYCDYEDEILVCKNYGNIGKLKTKLATLRIEREIDSIKRDTKNMNDKDKIIYVYNYVASHDYNRLFMYAKSNQSAYSFFTGGKSVCAGFAKASQIILQNVGINSLTAIDDDHMWNYVEYNKKWYIFDATVGASYHNKKHKNYYEGLGRTTEGVDNHFFADLYPKIEEEQLIDIFDLR